MGGIILAKRGFVKLAKNKAVSLKNNAKLYWKNPPEGRYMPYKEITSLSVGGIGVRLVVYCIGQMILSINNSLIGNTIGINPDAIYVIYIISVLSGFPLTAIRARMIDNTRSMKGKYRPYILTMGIPTFLLGALFMLMPYERMSLFAKCATVLFFNIGFQFFYNFYVDAYESLINVLSPNSIERSDVLSIRSVVENFSPSIASIFLPLFARLVTGQNELYNAQVYRVMFPPLLLVGFLLSMLVYVNTEEKIVQAKTHIIQLKFIDAFRAIAKNKYFWIISLAGWIGFLETSFNSILGWMYHYQQACSAGQYAIITALAGNASFWPNLIAPYFIRRYGKKKILVYTNVLNIGCIALMYPVVRMTGSPNIIWLLLLCHFVNQFISALGHLLNPSIQADIRDYQQYVSGERIDGMFAAVGLIGSAISLVTSSVLPTLYTRAGLNEQVAASFGYTNVYDVLYQTDYFVSISSVLVMASVLGAALNVIPFFFYDLTETGQKAMVRVLKIRAMFEDYGNGVLTDTDIKEAIEIINEAREFADKTPVSVSRDGIKAARKTKDKEQIKAAKKAWAENRLINEKIEIGKTVLAELNYFDSEKGAAEYENACRIVAAGMENISGVAEVLKQEASTLSGKERKALLAQVRTIRIAERAIKKYYPDGVEEFDKSVFDKLFKAEYENDVEISQQLAKLKSLKEAGIKEGREEVKSEIKALRKVRGEIQREIKKATAQNSIYYRATKPCEDARKTVARRKNYRNLDKIEQLYVES